MRLTDILSPECVKVPLTATDKQGIIAEIDINPLIVLEEGKGVKAVDALILLHGLKDD